MTASTALAQAPQRKNVLVINEHGPVHRAIAILTEQLLSQLASSPDSQTEFYIESLDSTLFDERHPENTIEAALVERYQRRKIDVIVATGPTAIRFLAGVADSFLPGVPVVICGSTADQAGRPPLGPRFTGSWMTLEPAKTIDVALKLLPDTRHVVVVGGGSTFDRGVEAITKASLQAHPFPVDITYLTDLEMSSLLDSVRHLPPQTLVLYLSFFRDAAGNQFVNATTALPLVAEASNVPVFGISDTYLGHGVVGGYVMSFADQGKIAAHTAREILSGKKPGDLPIGTSPGLYMFDWKQLERWNMSESRLPAGSIVLYREPSLWARAKWAVIGSLLVILGLAAIIAYLLRKKEQLNAARSEQVRLSGMLIEGQEAERRRLASELHDDFSQRLALLSLGLETAAEAIPESPQDADRQLHELMNSASELGADLHTLAHRLHSATLEQLGLVPGVSALCKEFAAQDGIRVAFTHVGVPKAVPSEVSLCLFRVVQEALRNVRKHSGASQADVKLEILDNMIHLSIADSGKGFDVNGDSRNYGLGVWSMQERAQLIGARFQIRSERLKGTQIDVWARPRQQKGIELANQFNLC